MQDYFECVRCGGKMKNVDGDIEYNEYGQYMGYIKYECEECEEIFIDYISGQ